MQCNKVFSSVFNHVKSSVWWPRFHCCVEFFFQCLRNLGNIAKIFSHALSISKKHNMIAFLTLEGYAAEWRWWSVVTCYEGILWCRLEFRGWVNSKQSKLSIRGGVLEDVLGLEDIFWSPWPRKSSPWPWPRGLKSSKIGLSSARGQHYFLNCLNFVKRLKNFLENVFLWRSLEKFLWRPFFFGDRLKNFCDFGEHLRLCPWSLALASSIPVLGLESVCPRKGCPWPWPRFLFVSLALASSLVPSTPPLLSIQALHSGKGALCFFSSTLLAWIGSTNATKLTSLPR